MNKPTFGRATNVVTLRCNLKCKLCVISSPYYTNPWHPTLEYVNSVTDRLFEIANFDIFDITGGEPLVRSDLPQILEHMARYQEFVTHRFGFQTNGSIPVSNDLVDACKLFGNKFKVIVDNYGESLSPYSHQNYELLKTNGIPVELRHQYSQVQYCDGWVDYIEDGQIFNTQEEAKNIFAKCAQSQIMGFCCVVIEGCVIPCPVMYSLKKRYNFPLPEAEFIDLFDKTQSLEEIRSKWLQIYQLDKLSACTRCSGICADSKRYIPAEQLTKEK